MEFPRQDTLPDGISLRSLKREAYKVMQSAFNSSSLYPTLRELARSFEAERSNLPILDLAELIGRDHKIELIKEIRIRYVDSNGGAMGLYEAKTLADGIYKSKGW